MAVMSAGSTPCFDPSSRTDFYHIVFAVAACHGKYF
jgi:hypothetical protein